MNEICGNPHFDFRYVTGNVPDYIYKNIDKNPIRPGIQVNIRRHSSHIGLSEKWEVHSPTLMFDFVISGEYSCTISSKKEPVYKRSGSSSISYLQGQSRKVTFVSDSQVLWLGILVDVPVMQELLCDGANRVSKQFTTILENQAGDHPLSVERKTSKSMLSILYQILNCRYQGAIGKLFIECKALELLFMRLSTDFIEPLVICRDISQSDQDSLYYARHILERSMENAPTISSLAKEVGLSESKLKRGSVNFKHLFGKPVYEFLKARRLETAKEMLISGEWNVRQTAMEVGYSSLSHFTHIFRRHFGVVPSRIKKNG